MRFKAIRNNWLLAITFFIVCLFVFFSVGCIKGKKKAEPAPAPGEEWTADMRERIESSIADSGKKTQMLLMVDQMEVDLIKLDQTIRKHYSDLLKIDRNYAAEPEDFRKKFKDFNMARYQIRDQIIEARFKIKEIATPGEWQNLTDISKKKGLFKESMQYPGL